MTVLAVLASLAGVYTDLTSRSSKRHKTPVSYSPETSLHPLRGEHEN